MTPVISVVIPTHNPRMDYLARVIDALRGQTLSKDLWELVIVDNGSREALEGVKSQASGGSRKVFAQGPSRKASARCFSLSVRR
jgi:glycosyltransferase involved in cell wall biosynthesis